MFRKTEIFLPGVEVRVKPDGTSRSIVGLLPYGKSSAGLPWLEIVERGAFASALEPGALIRALRDHNGSQILGSTTAGTLQLRDTAQGLQFTIQLPDVSYANDLIESMTRGDIATNCCSFGFFCIEDAWSETANGELQRRLLQVELLEISIVSGDAAYPDTQAALRSVPKALRALIKRSDVDDEDEDDDECQCEKNPDGSHVDPDCHCDDDEDEDDDEERNKPLTWSERTLLQIEVARRK